MKILLQHSEGLELFSHILSIYLKEDLSSFKGLELYKKIEEYDSLNRCMGIEKKIFDSTGKKIYEICRKIRNNEPIIISDEDFQNYTRYIGKGLNIGEYLSAWVHNIKQSSFENTKWKIYYYSETSEVQGICRGIVTFHQWQKVEVKSFNAENKATETYSGRCTIFGQGGRFMQIDLKLDPNKERDLHIILYLGSGATNFALGQYHNYDESVYSGTVIMKLMSTKDDDEPDFIDFKTAASLDEFKLYLIDYFRNKRLNYFKVPRNINSEQKIINWLKLKKKNNSKGA